MLRDLAHQRDVRDLARRLYDHPGDAEVVHALQALTSSADDGNGATSWTPVDVTAALDGTTADEPPLLLTRNDGAALMYAGRRHLFMGEPEACKGWTMLTASKPFTRGNIAGVRSRLPYAGVIEYGGTIRPRGVPIEFRRYQPVSRAIERNADQIAEELGDRIEDLTRRHGFK